MHRAGARAPSGSSTTTMSSPARAAANAERLDADAVEVLIGPYASDLPSVMASLEWLSPDLVINADSFDDEGVLAGASLSPRYARRRLGSWPRRCRSFRRPSAPTPRGSWAEPVGAASRLRLRVRTRSRRGHRGHPGPGRSARLPGRPGLRRLSDRPTLPGGGRRRRRVAVARGLRPGLWDVLRAVPYRSCNGPAGRSRDGPRAVAAREEARGLAGPPCPRPGPCTRGRNGPMPVGVRADED